MFIQTEATPNPASMKFLPGRTVLEAGTMDMRDAESAAQSPLATKLFAIPNVAGVFFGQDFIAVTKSEGDWNHLKPAILGAVMEHFLSGEPIVRAGADISSTSGGDDEFFDEKDAPMVATIKELIETRVRPAVASDGGDITFKGYRDGVVFLNMRGACAGCPSSTATLKNGIENLLRHFVPDVTEVRPV
jgi:Fe-S cluster biogenesis protein NfuA